MMRLSRILCLILTVGLLISSLVVSASADELFDNSWFNLLDFTGRQMFYFSKGERAFSWSLPDNMILCQIDMVFKSQGNINAVYYNHPYYGRQQLSLVSIGDQNYRVYGSWPAWEVTSLDLIFDFSGSSWIYPQSFYVSTSQYLSFDDVCFINVNGSSDIFMTSPNSQVSYQWGGTTAYANQAEYKASIFLQNWQKYDFVDVVFDVHALSIDSVSCVLDDFVIPYEISILESNGDSWIPDPYDQDTAILENMHTYSVALRLDLRGIDRSSSNYVHIAVNGTYAQNNSGNRFVVRRYSGYIMTDDVNPFFYYFQELRISLTAMFNDLKEALNPSGDTSQGDVLKEQGQQMEAYEKQHQDALQNGVGTLQASSNIGNFATALAFVGNYTTSTFNSLGDYQVVITLPLVIGLILFLASRAPGHSRPRKSDRSTQNEADRAEKPKNNNSEV